MNNIKYYINGNNQSVKLENWMRLAIAIPYYLKSSKSIHKLFINLPENHYFSNFTVLGSLLCDIENGDKRFNLKEYEKLEPGDYVNYLRNGKWVQMKFEKIIDSPSNTNIKLMQLKEDHNRSCLIEDYNWTLFVRTINQSVNLAKYQKLMEIFGEEVISNICYYSSPKTFLYTTKKDWLMSDVHISINNIQCKLTDIIHFNSKGYNNLLFLSNKNILTNIEDPTALVVFNGATKSLRYYESYSNINEVFLIDRKESNERIGEFIDSLENHLAINQYENDNKNFLHFLNENNITLPMGVEIIVAKR